MKFCLPSSSGHEFLFQGSSQWEHGISVRRCEHCLCCVRDTYFNRKWVFYLLHIDKSLVKLKVGGATPDVLPVWLVAAALGNSADPSDLIRISRPETLAVWGFGIQITFKISEEDINRVEVFLANYRRFDEALKSRLPLWHWCLTSGRLHPERATQILNGSSRRGEGGW